MALRDLTGAGYAQALLLRLALSQHQQFQLSVHLLNLAVLCRALRAQVEPYLTEIQATSSIRYLPIARGQRLDDMFISSRMACCSRPSRSRCRGSLLRQNACSRAYSAHDNDRSDPIRTREPQMRIQKTGCENRIYQQQSSAYTVNKMLPQYIDSRSEATYQL